MSQANVELHRRIVEAFNTRDFEAFIAYFDPNVEFHSVFAAVGGGVYHGHSGVRSWYRDFEDAWGDEIRFEPDVYFDVGEHTLLFLLFHGRGRHSGAEVAMPVARVARWRDGLPVYVKGYADREEALRNLGVSEGELEPIEP